MKSIELFAGAGGLGMGITRAGFKHVAVVEWDKYAFDTLQENQIRKHPLVSHWPITKGDVREFDYSPFEDKVTLVAGGPPCQPFSLGGKHQGFLDSRDMFPQAIRAVREVRPQAFIFENVKGLTRRAFDNYRQYILLQLEFPEIHAKRNEQWPDHMRRLEKQKTKGSKAGLTYNIVNEVLNAADYGVPQRRERIFIVGFRSDLNLEWSFPSPTHSEQALLLEKYATGKYWERLNVSRKERALVMSSERARTINNLAPSKALPWRTVRDAIIDLPPPSKSSPSGIANHKFQAGARTYAGHTGSPLDEPAKTLKAGDHGVPGGENMLRNPDGTVRYFSVRESARLQCFPDDFVFHGSWTETMRQLGNAVPVNLAEVVARSVRERLRKLR